MSLNDLFTRDLWEGVGRSLRGSARAWWDENEEALVGAARDEIEAVARSLESKDTIKAKLFVASRMTREEFDAWQDETIAALDEIGKRRARLLDALEDLGIRAARIIGKAILGVLR